MPYGNVNRAAPADQAGAGQRTAEDLMWNWARWCWVGATVGNMQPYVSYQDNYHPILVDDARAVDAMHRRLPHHEAMIITAEYPQRNVRFADMAAPERRRAAIRWILSVTGLQISEQQYQLYLGLFLHDVSRRLL